MLEREQLKLKESLKKRKLDVDSKFDFRLRSMRESYPSFETACPVIRTGQAVTNEGELRIYIFQFFFADAHSPCEI